MMMVNWRDLAALLLLAHLMTLSKGRNVEENGAFEEILSKNLSVILIGDKAEDLLDIGNVTSSKSGYNNSSSDDSSENNDSTVLNSATIKNEKILEAELEEAIESAATSGQVILISPPADRINSTNQLPLIIIENPADSYQTALSDTSIDKTIDESSAKLDQEIAQSQTRPRSHYENYGDSENSENLEDLLAIAEYEPQRIDAKGIDEENPPATREERNLEGRTTRRPLTQERHYDVPKRRNHPRNWQRISDVYGSATPKPDLKASSTGNVQLAAAPTKLYPVKIDQKNPKAERRQFSSPSTFDRNPTAVYGDSSRDGVHPKIEMSLPTKSSLARGFTHDTVPRRASTLAGPTSTDATSRLVPGLSGKIEDRLRNSRNLNSVSEQLKKNNIYSSRVRTTESSSPSSFRSIPEDRTPFGGDESIDSIPPTSGLSRAERRIDNYYSAPQRAESSSLERRPLTNEQLGFLTRYNLPSLVTGKLAGRRSLPVAPRNTQTGSSKGSREEVDGSETTNPRRSRTVISVRHPYDVNGRKNTSGKPVVDYRNDGRASDGITTPVYDSYEEDDEETAPNNHRLEDTAHRPEINQPLASTTSVHDSYEKSVESKTLRPSPVASTTPSYDFYEDYKESSNSKTAKNSPVEYYGDYKESAENSKAARNSPVEYYEDYKESAENSKAVRKSPVASHEDYREPEKTRVLKNSPVASATPVYDSYDDYEESDSLKVLPLQQGLAPNDAEQRQRSPIHSYPASSQPPRDNPAETIQRETPINLLTNPIYQIHGLKSNPIPANGVYKPYASYPARNPSRLASLEKQNIKAPRATVNSQRVIYTTPAHDYHEDSLRTGSPSATPPITANPNYLENHFAKPIYNNIDKNIESTSTSPRKKSAEYVHRERVRKPYAVNPANAISPVPSPLPSQGPIEPQRDPHRGKVSSPTHVESTESDEYEESIDRGVYSPDSKGPRAPKVTQYRETNHRGTSSSASPAYDSYENDDRKIIVSPSDRANLIEPRRADYGNRIRAVEQREDRVVARSSSDASSTRPGRRENARTTSALNYEDRRPFGSPVDEVPVESVNRAGVEDSSDHEDEVPAGSGREEKHENYETHEEAKDGGGGGGGGGGGEQEHEEGGGEKHKEDHRVSHGEKGDEGYEAWEEHDKGEKGHHDKEEHDKEYEEKKGEKKKHEDESDYHKEHHHEEKGDKEAEFGEKGEHQKGHSTKGQHVVHKKDEYEKKTEFYDESHEEDGEEKEGGYGEEHEYAKGGHEKIGHHDSARHEDKYGKNGEHEKGHHYHENKGHKNSDGHDEHHRHEGKYGKKGGHEEGNKWSYKKGDDGKKDS